MENKSQPAVALSKTIIKPTSMLVQPVASNEQIITAWQNYQKLKEELLNENDYQEIQGKKCIKKSGWRKLQTAFGISDELIKEERKTQGNYFTYEATVKVSTQNGRFAFGIGSCASNERRFAHIEHDVRSTAHTRAKNRAISDLIGGGEVSAEEMDFNTVEDKNEEALVEDNEWLNNIYTNQELKPKKEIQESRMITDKQKSLLTSLIYQKILDSEEREKRMSVIDEFTKSDASEAISELLANNF